MLSLLAFAAGSLLADQPALFAARTEMHRAALVEYAEMKQAADVVEQLEAELGRAFYRKDPF